MQQVESNVTSQSNDMELSRVGVHKCAHCFRSFDNRMSLVAHSRVHGKKQNGMADGWQKPRDKCRGCGREFAYHKPYMNHLPKCNKFKLHKEKEDKAEEERQRQTIASKSVEIDPNTGKPVLSLEADGHTPIHFGSRSYESVPTETALTNFDGTTSATTRAPRRRQEHEDTNIAASVRSFPQAAVNSKDTDLAQEQRDTGRVSLRTGSSSRLRKHEGTEENGESFGLQTSIGRQLFSAHRPESEIHDFVQTSRERALRHLHVLNNPTNEHGRLNLTSKSATSSPSQEVARETLQMTNTLASDSDSFAETSAPNGTASVPIIPLDVAVDHEEQKTTALTGLSAEMETKAPPLPFADTFVSKESTAANPLTFPASAKPETNPAANPVTLPASAKQDASFCPAPLSQITNSKDYRRVVESFCDMLDTHSLANQSNLIFFDTNATDSNPITCKIEAYIKQNHLDTSTLLL